MKKKIGRPFGSKNKPKDTAKIVTKAPRARKPTSTYSDGFLDGFIAAMTHARENPRTVGIDLLRQW